MNITLNIKNGKGALINIGDATFYIYANSNSTSSGEFYPYCDFHIHAGFEVQYINSGSFILETETGQYKGTRGNVFVIPPNNYHQTSSASGVFNRQCFSFSVFPNDEKESNNEYLLYNRILSKITQVTVLKSSDFTYIMERVMALENSDDKNSKNTIFSLLTVFLMDVFTELDEYLKTNKSFKKKEDKQKFNRLNERQKYIIENTLADHFDKDNPSEIIENVLNTSKRNAARIVYNLFGENISEMVLKYRMKIAKMYIENTDMNLNQISEKVGYRTYVAFFTAFKKYYGMPPKEYKEKL